MMKQNLRNVLLKRRDTLTIEELHRKSHQIFEQLIPYLKQASCVGVYHSFSSEVETYEIIQYLKEHNIRVGLPVCEKNRTMNFYELQQDTTFKQRQMGMWEPMDAKKISPEEIDFMIVPMVGFYKNQRLGYGGGYYDRYLVNCPAYKIGIAFSLQESEFINEPFDIAMDVVIHEI